MTEQRNERRRASRHLITGLLALVIGLGLTASAAFAGVPTSPPVQKQPSKGLSVAGNIWSAVQPGAVLPDVPSNCTSTGAITTSDPTQTARLFRDGIPDTCSDPNDPCSTIAGTFHYDAYIYTNLQNTEQCITVSLTTTCAGNTIYSASYIGSFEPGSICTNYLAGAGNSPNPVASYSFNVPANATFVVVVSEVNAGSGCSEYTVEVVGDVTCPTGGTTPTTTSTATSTVIPSMTLTSTVTEVPSLTPTSTVTATPSVTLTSTATVTIPVTATPCEGKVTICHSTGSSRGQTIMVSCEALPAHLSHGDTIGACTEVTPDVTP